MAKNPFDQVENLGQKKLNCFYCNDRYKYTLTQFMYRYPKCGLSSSLMFRFLKNTISSIEYQAVLIRVFYFTTIFRLE